MSKKLWFVTIIGTYLDNAQAYHAFEGPVIAENEKQALEAAERSLSLKKAFKTHRGPGRSGEHVELPIWKNPDELDSELILDDTYVAPFVTHFFNSDVVVAGGLPVEPSHPRVMEAVRAFEKALLEAAQPI